MLVGDPKQAIYRFRGGDVTNYNLIKHYGNQDLLIKAPLMNQSLSLTVNRRSSKALIEALNAWFDNNHQDAVANHANLGQGIFISRSKHIKTVAVSIGNLMLMPIIMVNIP